MPMVISASTTSSRCTYLPTSRGATEGGCATVSRPTDQDLPPRSEHDNAGPLWLAGWISISALNSWTSSNAAPQQDANGAASPRSGTTTITHHSTRSPRAWVNSGFSVSRCRWNTVSRQVQPRVRTRRRVDPAHLDDVGRGGASLSHVGRRADHLSHVEQCRGAREVLAGDHFGTRWLHDRDHRARLRLGHELARNQRGPR